METNVVYDFLEKIRNNDKIEIRVFDRNNKYKFAFTLPNHNHIHCFGKLLNNTNYNLYYGVGNIRNNVKPGRVKNSDVVKIKTLFFDIDTKNPEEKEWCYKTILEDTLIKSSISYIVDSGNGLHVYINNDCGDLEDFDIKENFIIKHLSHKRLPVDSKVKNRGRILRIPLSYNTKNNNVYKTKILYCNKNSKPFNIDTSDMKHNNQVIEKSYTLIKKKLNYVFTNSKSSFNIIKRSITDLSGNKIRSIVTNKELYNLIKVFGNSEIKYKEMKPNIFYVEFPIVKSKIKNKTEGLLQLLIMEIYPKNKIILKNKKKYNCIFHKEKSPSMVYYKDSDSLYCFGCGKLIAPSNIIQDAYKSKKISLRKMNYLMGKYKSLIYDNSSNFNKNLNIKLHKINKRISKEHFLNIKEVFDSLTNKFYYIWASKIKFNGESRLYYFLYNHSNNSLNIYKETEELKLRYHIKNILRIQKTPRGFLSFIDYRRCCLNYDVDDIFFTYKRRQYFNLYKAFNHLDNISVNSFIENLSMGEFGTKYSALKVPFSYSGYIPLNILKVLFSEKFKIDLTNNNFVTDLFRDKIEKFRGRLFVKLSYNLKQLNKTQIIDSYKESEKTILRYMKDKKFKLYNFMSNLYSQCKKTYIHKVKSLFNFDYISKDEFKSVFIRTNQNLKVLISMNVNLIERIYLGTNINCFGNISIDNIQFKKGEFSNEKT